MSLRELTLDLGFAATLLRRRRFQCFLLVTNRCNMRCGFCDCQQCWTVCRGFNQTLDAGGSLRGWIDLGVRMRSH